MQFIVYLYFEWLENQNYLHNITFIQNVIIYLSICVYNSLNKLQGSLQLLFPAILGVKRALSEY